MTFVPPNLSPLPELNYFGNLLQVIKAEEIQNKKWQLTEEGISVLQKGSHEAVVFAAIPAEGIDQAQLMVTGFWLSLPCLADVQVI